MSKVFDVVKTPLSGRHLIEASAGTGKTYSLIHIVLRLIIEEKIAIDRLLLVTFTKAATAELKQRVRNLLIQAHEAFLESKEEEDERYDKTLLKLIAKWRLMGIKEEVFKEAIDRMDDASICTIHSFCQKMLDEHRFSSSEGFDFEFGEDTDFKNEVIEQFLRKELTEASDDRLKTVLLSSSPWRDILDAITAAPKDSTIEFFEQQVFIDPRTSQAQNNLTDDQVAIEKTVRKVLERFIATVPEELRSKKREAGIRSFDDLLMDMYAQLNNTLFIKGVQQRYDGVLIDEFQDTDPIQYAIFKRLFLSGDSTARSVFFVGDPKQSIYRFRNADLNTYLAAKADIAEVYELDVNYRSSPKLLDAFNRFYCTSQKPFLDSGIDYRAIKAGATKSALLVRTPEGEKELPVFEVWQKNEKTTLNPASSRDQQSALIANEIEALLSGSVYKAADKKLLPSDIAILVHHKKDAHCLIEYLTKKGIRVLFQDDNNIFQTEEAREMLLVLKAIESPEDVRTLKLARSTRLMGESINNIVPEAFSTDDEKVDDLAALKARELIEQALILAEKRGIAAALSRIMLECKTQNRLLPVQNGERRLANYQQLIEFLQEASLSLKGISGLTRWLTQKIAHPGDDERYRLRIDSDANLVNVMTIHKSKGLEFPVVFLLYANELNVSGGARYKKNVFKEVRDGKITLKICFTQLYPEVVESINHEQELEILRLAYVAMTRASQRLVMPLTYFKSNSKLKGFDNAYTRSLIGKSSVSSEEFETKVQSFFDQGKDSGIFLRNLDDEIQILDWHQQCVATKLENVHTEELSAAHGQSIPTSWFPTSYTALARGAAETSEALTLIEEKEDSSIEDNDVLIGPPSENQPAASELSIMDFERGLESGTFLHALFEKADFSLVKEAFEGNDEAEQKLNHQLLRQVQPFKYHMQPYGVEKWLPVFNRLLKDVLCSRIVDRTIFGTQKDLRLCELVQSAKTSEMGFTIPIGETLEGREAISAKNLSRLLKHFDSIYHIEIENNHTLKGYLTGAIDLTFEFEGRFFVLDWKGTKLADQPEGFNAERMLQEVERHHYSLQYLIYLVALRRHLKFCGIEDADQKIGGVIYAFIRGIHADDYPPYGVLTAQPPLAIIQCLDDFFAHGYDERTIRQFAAQKDN